MSDPRLSRALDEAAASMDTGAHAVTLGEVRARARSIRRRRRAGVAGVVAVLAALPFNLPRLDLPRSEPARDPQRPVHVVLDVDAPIDDAVPEPFLRHGRELHLAGETIELDRSLYSVQRFGDGFLGLESGDGPDFLVVLDSDGQVVSRTVQVGSSAVVSADGHEAAVLGRYGVIQHLTADDPRPRDVLRPGGADATTVVGVREGRVLYRLRSGGAFWVEVDTGVTTTVPLASRRDLIVAVLPDGSLLGEHTSSPVNRNQNCVYRTVGQRRLWERCGVTVPPRAVSPDARHVLVSGYYASPEEMQVLRIDDGATTTSASIQETRDDYYRFLAGPWYDDTRVRLDVYVADPDAEPGDRGIVLTVVGEERGMQRSLKGLTGASGFRDEPIPGPVEAG